MSWLKNALLQSNKPKHSIIGTLRHNLGGQQQGRDRSILHASDVTKPGFCPRREALLDIIGIDNIPSFLPVAMDVTFRVGSATERMIVEEWGTGYVVGNWRCRLCGDQRTMCKKPDGYCKDKRRHSWEYVQIRITAPDYDLSGGVDAFWDVGTPLLMITELKIIANDEFEKMVAPLPEHRLRTNLYMKLIAGSDWVYKDKFNLHEARVLYVCRGHGKKHPEWENEVLPFKEFQVKRDDLSLVETLQKAKAIKRFRTEQKMPSGICHTSTDTYAKSCSCRAECFSGQYPAQIKWELL